MCFESFEEAKMGYQQQGECQERKKSPVGKFGDMEWGQQALLEEVQSYKLSIGQSLHGDMKSGARLVNWQRMVDRSYRSI